MVCCIWCVGLTDAPGDRAFQQGIPFASQDGGACRHPEERMPFISKVRWWYVEFRWSPSTHTLDRSSISRYGRTNKEVLGVLTRAQEELKS